MFGSLRILLVAVLLICVSASGKAAHGQSLPFTGTLVSDTSLVLDSNAPCVDGPRSGYVAFKLTNNGATRAGVYVDLMGFANGLALSRNQSPRQYVGTWLAGTTRTLYWFIEYPCTFGSYADLTARVTEASSGNTADVSETVVTKSMISSNGGGKLVAGGVGPGAVIGQTIYADVQYEFGGADAGTTYSLQASGTIAHNAQCFQLVKTEIIASNVTAVPAGTQDQMFFTATAKQAGSGYELTMRYWFKYLCMGQNSYLQPYTNQLSGMQLKYSGNWGSFIGPSLPSASNAFTVSKSMTPTMLGAGGAVTYTITVKNTSSFTAAVDSIIDVMPSGVTFTGLHASGNVTAGNSSSVPANGASGTVVFRGPWDVAGNDSLRLVYTANVPSTPGTYTNNASAHTGIATIGSGSASTVVGQADIRVTKAGSTSAATGDSLRYIITTTNLGPNTASNIVVTDTLPLGVTLVRATRGATLNGGVLTWPALNSTNGQMVHDTVVIMTPGVISTITNVAAATAATYDPAPANNNGSLAAGRVVTSVAAAATDITVAKAAADTFAVGSNGSYTITVTNQGGTSTGNIVVTDTLPAGLTYVSANGAGWTFNAVGQLVTATYSGAALAAGASASFTLTTSISAQAVPSVTNRAWVTGGGDTNTANNGTGDVITALAGIVDLSITKTSPPSFTVGVSGTYTITVTNAGSATTSGTITVRDTLPVGITFVSGSGAGWTVNHAAGVITAAYPAALAASASVAFTLTVSPQAAAVPSVTNKAVVAGGSQTYFANDTARVTTAVSGFVDLSIAKTSSALTQWAAGSYTITVTNGGVSASSGTVTVVDTLPAGVAFVSGSGTGWTIGASGQIVTATFNTAIAAGANASFTLNVDIGGGVASLTNRAHMTNASDGDTGNNTGTVTTTVTQKPDVQLTKTSSAPFVIGTSTATYSFVVRNQGYATTSGPITVTDTLPAGIAYLSRAGTNWTVSYNAATRVVTATTTSALGIGAVAQTLTITVSVGMGVASPLSNTGWVSGGGENNTTNNSSSVTTSVSGADLQIAKTSTAFTPLTSGSYTVAVQNVGTSATSGTVTVTDTMPAGLTLTAGSTTQNGWSITTTLVSGRYHVVATHATAIAAGASTSFTVNVSVTAAAMPSVTNKVYLSNTSQFNPVNDTSVVVTAVASPDLTVSKLANGTFNGGGAADYTIEVTNSGTYVSAGSIVVTDVLPAGLTYNAAGTSGTGWTFASSGQTVTATFAGPLAAAASTSFTLGVNVLESAGGSIDNTASLTGGNDQNTTNNTSTATTPVMLGEPNMTLVKAVSPAAATAVPGDILTYTITALNSGTARAVNLVISDNVPVQLMFQVGSAGTTLPSGVTAVTDYFGSGAWGYTPVSAGCGAPVGYDACVTRVRWTLPSLPTGLSASTFFAGRVK